MFSCSRWKPTARLDRTRARREICKRNGKYTVKSPWIDLSAVV